VLRILAELDISDYGKTLHAGTASLTQVVLQTRMILIVRGRTCALAQPVRGHNAETSRYAFGGAAGSQDVSLNSSSKAVPVVDSGG
jgi:hypothetical protein